MRRCSSRYVSNSCWIQSVGEVLRRGTLGLRYSKKSDSVLRANGRNTGALRAQLTHGQPTSIQCVCALTAGSIERGALAFVPVRDLSFVVFLLRHTVSRNCVRGRCDSVNFSTPPPGDHGSTSSGSVIFLSFSFARSVLVLLDFRFLYCFLLLLFWIIRIIGLICMVSGRQIFELLMVNRWVDMWRLHNLNVECPSLQELHLCDPERFLGKGIFSLSPLVDHWL